jgi:hypothetical protein
MRATVIRSALYRLAIRFAKRSRDEKWAIYQGEFPPTPDEKVIDVGVSSLDTLDTENFFLRRYPHPSGVTAVGVQNLDGLVSRYPGVTFLTADGRDLPFDSKAFGVAHSNAVIEHVGDYTQQRRFVHEICRVAETGMITTPNRWFPVDSHTQVPFVHWLPRPLMLAGLRLFGHREFDVWLLSRRRFVALFPATAQVKVKRTRMGGMTATWVVIFRMRPS